MRIQEWRTWVWCAPLREDWSGLLCTFCKPIVSHERDEVFIFLKAMGGEASVVKVLKMTIATAGATAPDG